MESIESKIMVFILWRMNMKRSIDRYFKKAEFEQEKSQTPSKKIRSKVHVETEQFMGRDVITMRPKTSVNKAQILYFHGGAYIYGIKKFHYNFVLRLIQSTGSTVIMPDYPLAPNQSAADVYDMALTLYQRLSDDKAAEQIILMGDSSGGGIALGLAQYLRDHGIRQPDKIILLSPWLDVTMSNPEIKNVDRSDPILGIDGLITAGSAYAKDWDRKDYRVSPIYGEFRGLSDIHLFISTHDLLYPDARKFSEIMQQKGIALKYHEYPGLFHDWMLFNLPESQSVLEHISESF